MVKGDTNSWGILSPLLQFIQRSLSTILKDTVSSPHHQCVVTASSLIPHPLLRYYDRIVKFQNFPHRFSSTLYCIYYRSHRPDRANWLLLYSNYLRKIVDDMIGIQSILFHSRRLSPEESHNHRKEYGQQKVALCNARGPSHINKWAP